MKIAQTPTYTLNEFNKLRHVDYEDILKGLSLVTLIGNVNWYKLIDTPRGEMMLYEEADKTGFPLVKHLEIRFINHTHRLNPESFERIRLDTD